MDDRYIVNEDKSVTDTLTEEVFDSCYCDNTHDQNDTICVFCWGHGRRLPTDPVKITKSNTNS
jgi:hypothetical protein